MTEEKIIEMITFSKSSVDIGVSQQFQDNNNNNKYLENELNFSYDNKSANLLYKLKLEEIKIIKTYLLRKTETLKKEKEEFEEEKLHHYKEKENWKKQMEEITFMRKVIQQKKEILELERLIAENIGI